MKKFRYKILGTLNKNLLLHGIFWTAFIAYEIILAETLIGSGHPLNYLLHYLLYAALFYLHAALLRKTVNYPRINLLLLIGGLVAEAGTFYLFNILITLLVSRMYQQVPPDFFSLIALAQVAYRLLYVGSMSTAFWMGQLNLQQYRKLNELQQLRLKSRIHQGHLEAEKLQAELAFLKAQIRPHFLLNVLQNIYTQAQRQPSQVAQSIMQLSELLQNQLIADTHLKDIPLAEEIRYIRRYLDLQGSLRKIYLKFEYREIKSNEIETLLFPPLILLTLVENIFQHGELGNPRNPASIQLKLSSQKLQLRVYNAIKQAPLRKNGIGMKNVKRRLQYLFPGRFELQERRNSANYELQLNILLKHYD